MKTCLLDKIVKLEGTDYDRRRKLKNKDIIDIRKDHNRGATISSLAKKYNVSYNTIHYHVDEDYKQFHNQRRLNSVRSCCNNSEYRNSRIKYKKSILARVSI